MLQNQRFAFLTAEFYNDFPSSEYPEIEQKPLRPYIQVLTTINNQHFAIPLRSNINHPHVLWTDRANRCGVDFSKAVIPGAFSYGNIYRAKKTEGGLMI